MWFGVMSFAAILLSGCAARRRPAIPWSTAVLVRPNAPQPTSSGGAVEAPVPDVGMEMPPPPAPLAERTAPARPRSIEPASNEKAPAKKLEAPQIVPDLSAQESASLQHETEASLNVAGRNLSVAAGKSLNPTQADLASKVRSFISDAREAGRAGDWARALNLAKKAEVLSQQLAGSL